MSFVVMSGPQWLGWHLRQEDAQAAANEARALNQGVDIAVYQQIDPPVPEVPKEA